MVFASFETGYLNVRGIDPKLHFTSTSLIEEQFGLQVSLGNQAITKALSNPVYFCWESTQTILSGCVTENSVKHNVVC